MSKKNQRTYKISKWRNLSVVRLTDKEIEKGTNRRLRKKKIPDRRMRATSAPRVRFRTNEAARRPATSKAVNVLCI